MSHWQGGGGHSGEEPDGRCGVKVPARAALSHQGTYAGPSKLRRTRPQALETLPQQQMYTDSLGTDSVSPPQRSTGNSQTTHLANFSKDIGLDQRAHPLSIPKESVSRNVHPRSKYHLCKIKKKKKDGKMDYVLDASI